MPFGGDGEYYDNCNNKEIVFKTFSFRLDEE